jgi:hypothetical protein
MQKNLRMPSDIDYLLPRGVHKATGEWFVTPILREIGWKYSIGKRRMVRIKRISSQRRSNPHREV